MRGKRTVEINVVSDAVAETADVYVCAYWDGPVYFDDDKRGVCAGCAPGWIAATRH